MSNPDIKILKSDDHLPHLPWYATFWYSVANLGYGTFFSFNNAVISLFLAKYTNNNVILGLMSSSHSFEGAVIQPIIGAWSDRLRTRFGRRKPFILASIPLCCVLMALTPMAATLPASIRLSALVFLIFLFTVLFNIAFDPYQAMMPDITPPVQRGSVMGFWTLLGVLGQAGILLIPIEMSLKFYLVAALMLITTILTCVFVREPELPPLQEKHNKSIALELKLTLKGLNTLRQARKGLAVYGLYGIGSGAIMPFLTLFVKKITNCTDHQAEFAFMILMISTAVSVIPLGKIADKLGSMRVLFYGIVAIAIASGLAIFANSLSAIYYILILAGLGNAAQSASAYPLMTEIVPRDEIGLYTGFQTVALSVLQPLTVVIVGALMNGGNYRSVFIVCAISMVVAIAVLRTVRLDLAREEIKLRMAELTS